MYVENGAGTQRTDIKGSHRVSCKMAMDEKESKENNNAGEIQRAGEMVGAIKEEGEIEADRPKWRHLVFLPIALLFPPMSFPWSSQYPDDLWSPHIQ